MNRPTVAGSSSSPKGRPQRAPRRLPSYLILLLVVGLLAACGGPAVDQNPVERLDLRVSIDEETRFLGLNQSIDLTFDLARSERVTGEVTYAVTSTSGLVITPAGGALAPGNDSFTIEVADDDVPLGEHSLTVTVTGAMGGESVTDTIDVTISLAPFVSSAADAVLDPAPGTLRALLADPRTVGATITFAPELLGAGPVVIVLEEQLQLAHDVTIAGPSGWSVNDGPEVHIDGGGALTPILVSAGADVTLANLQVQNGHAAGAGAAGDGGGIRVNSGGALTLDGVFVRDNVAARNGGGIWSAGTLTVVNDSRVFDNEAGEFGGGVNVDGASATASFYDSLVSRNEAGIRGGGLYLNGGALELNATRVLMNTSVANGGGIFARRSGGSTMRITNGSEITGNEARQSGGGIYSEVSALIENSEVIGNEARSDGGGVRNHLEMEIRFSTISGNEAVGSYGGVFNDGVMTIADSLIEANIAGIDGGGIFNGWPASDRLPGDLPKEMVVERTVIRDNRAGTIDGGNGGGIHSVRKLTIIDSHITGNSAYNDDNDTGHGGGIYAVSIPDTRAPDNNGGELYVSGTTIDGNVAQRTGGGIYSDTVYTGNSGDTPSAPLILVNSTVTGNVAQSGGGLRMSGLNHGAVQLYFNTIAENQANGTGGQGGGVHNGREHVTIRGNIFAFNTSNMGGNDRDIYPSQNTITSEGYNYVTHSPHTAVQLGGDDITSPTVAHLGLEELADNGGLTPTMAIGAGSVAAQAVPAGECLNPDGAPLTVDQRGMGRPNAGNCSIGAYQLQAP